MAAGGMWGGGAAGLCELINGEASYDLDLGSAGVLWEMLNERDTLLD